MVGHAPTLEGSVRQLIGGTPKVLYDFTEITRKVDFLSTVSCEKDRKSHNWKIVTPLPLIKNFNIEFDSNLKKKIAAGNLNNIHCRSNPNLNQLTPAKVRQYPPQDMLKSSLPLLLHSRSSPNIVNPNVVDVNRNRVQPQVVDFSMNFKTQNFGQNVYNSHMEFYRLQQQQHQQLQQSQSSLVDTYPNGYYY